MTSANELYQHTNVVSQHRRKISEWINAQGAEQMWAQKKKLRIAYSRWNQSRSQDKHHEEVELAPSQPTVSLQADHHRESLVTPSVMRFEMGIKERETRQENLGFHQSARGSERLFQTG